MGFVWSLELGAWNFRPHLFTSAATKEFVRMVRFLNVPEGFAAMRSEAVQGADFGESAQFGFAEMRARFEIFKRCEGALREHMARMFFAQVAYDAKAEPDGVFYGAVLAVLTPHPGPLPVEGRGGPTPRNLLFPKPGLRC